MTDILAKYHASHDCKPAKCACKCGCTQMLGCTYMTDLCAVCHLAWIRDEDDEVIHEPINMKPDWHDLPTEPGLWLVHAKGSRTDVMACTIVTDEMMACIDEAIDADIDYCGPYALPPDTKEEK